MKNYTLHKFNKFPFGKYKNSTCNIANLIIIDFDYVLWFQTLPNITYSKCILKSIEKQKDVRYEKSTEKLNRKPTKNKLLTDDFLEYSGLEEAFRSSYFN